MSVRDESGRSIGSDRGAALGCVARPVCRFVRLGPQERGRHDGPAAPVAGAGVTMTPRSA